jgi:hypothetical protein
LLLFIAVLEGQHELNPFFCFFIAVLEGLATNVSFAVLQPSRRRGSEGDCNRSATEQQLAVTATCKINFGVDFYVLKLGLLFDRRARGPT